MKKHEIASEEIFKIDELCKKYPFTQKMILEFAQDAGAEAAIFLMEEIINENAVRKEKQMGEVAYAASFRQRSRNQRKDLNERLAKQKDEDKQKEEEERVELHALAVQAAYDSGYNPGDYKHLGAQIAQMGADGQASEGDVSLGLQFISSMNS